MEDKTNENIVEAVTCVRNACQLLMSASIAADRLPPELGVPVRHAIIEADVMLIMARNKLLDGIK